MALTGQQLCDKLGITAQQLSAWVRKGLPCEGRGKQRTFDPYAVRAWLLEHNLAEAPPAEFHTDQPIAHTWAQVAEYFQVAERTVATWIKQGMPGKSGRPGTREGEFPLHDIDAWREGRKEPRVTTGEETKSQAQARLSTIRADMLELELRERRGELIDAGEVARTWLRIQHEARAQLAQFPSMAAQQLAPFVEPKLRRKLRQLAQKLVDQALASLETFEVSEANSVEAADGKPEE